MAKLSTAEFKYKHRLYPTWNRMRNRCYCKSQPEYKNWGERGIVICERWQDAKNFIDDMEPTFKEGLTIDRINNNGNYSCGKCKQCSANGWPLNCRWATQLEQQRNRSNNRRFTYRGKSLLLSEWSKLLGIKRSTLAQRIYSYKWPIDRALGTEVDFG